MNNVWRARIRGNEAHHETPSLRTSAIHRAARVIMSPELTVAVYSIWSGVS
jgi:hypothetical protein